MLERDEVKMKSVACLSKGQQGGQERVGSQADGSHSGTGGMFQGPDCSMALKTQRCRVPEHSESSRKAAHSLKPVSRPILESKLSPHSGVRKEKDLGRTLVCRTQLCTSKVEDRLIEMSILLKVSPESVPTALPTAPCDFTGEQPGHPDLQGCRHAAVLE